MKNLVEIIPIILILLFILYTKSMVQLSYTVLGKLCAIALIVGYTMYDVLYGLVMCMMVILYYQLDSVENMQNLDQNIDQSMDQSIDQNMDQSRKNPILDDSITMNLNETADIMMNSNNSNVESMTTYYDFQKAHCRNNKLYHKEYPIRNDMTEHVFPEIKFESGVCNPCDPNCNISFTNKKIDTETELVLPKSSNDLFVDELYNLFGKDSHFFPRLDDLTHNFALFT